MDYPEYQARVSAWAKVATLFEYGRVSENGREYPLVCLTTKGAKELVVTAGFHGEEPAGPLTLLERFGELAQVARRHDVALRVFPCVNPSGFEGGHRYNASGEEPNNDFLRYELHDGSVKDEVAVGEPFRAWRPYLESPKETRALHQELAKHPPPAAALDLHQDAWVKAQCFYAYHFGDPVPYRALVEKCLPHAKVAIHVAVHNQVRTDRFGLLVHHDGSNSDWFHRRGVPHVGVLETSTRTPLERCHAVNFTWLEGFVELAARGR